MGSRVPTATMIWWPRPRPDVAETICNRCAAAGRTHILRRLTFYPSIFCKTSTVRQISEQLKIFHAASTLHQKQRAGVTEERGAPLCTGSGVYFHNTTERTLGLPFLHVSPSRHWSTYRRIMLTKTLSSHALWAAAHDSELGIGLVLVRCLRATSARWMDLFLICHVWQFVQQASTK